MLFKITKPGGSHHVVDEHVVRGLTYEPEQQVYSQPESRQPPSVQT